MDTTKDNHTQDELKRRVARAAVDYTLSRIEDKSIVGIGTGSTVNFFIDLLAAHKGRIEGTVASSETSAARLKKYGIPVYDLNTVDEVAIYIDGADEINPNLEMIKGGGAALTREKIIAAVANEVVCIADESKWVDFLGTFPLPVEVIPMALGHVGRQLVNLEGDPVYRQGLVTDNGNQIIDVHHLYPIESPKELESMINDITGVVTNGIFAARPADILLLATAKAVETIDRGRPRRL